MTDEIISRKCGACGFTSPTTHLVRYQDNEHDPVQTKWKCDACDTWQDERNIPLPVDPIPVLFSEPLYVEPWRPDAWAYFAAHAPKRPHGFPELAMPEQPQAGYPTTAQYVEAHRLFGLAFAEWVVSCETAWAAAYADAMMAEYAKVAK